MQCIPEIGAVVDLMWVKKCVQFASTYIAQIKMTDE